MKWQTEHSNDEHPNTEPSSKTHNIVVIEIVWFLYVHQFWCVRVFVRETDVTDFLNTCLSISTHSRNKHWAVWRVCVCSKVLYCIEAVRKSATPLCCNDKSEGETLDKQQKVNCNESNIERDRKGKKTRVFFDCCNAVRDNYIEPFYCLCFFYFCF